ncbi:MAG: hypothetical protein N2201_07360 [candidate division WOR-3 bacterium]|nr:hypothetical protein [candidate division WOR-3 bacterium]
MSIPSWKSDEYLSDSLLLSLLALKELGTTNIAITPAWYQLTISSNDIYPTSKTPSDSAVRKIILLADSIGFEIMLKPHIDLEDNSFRGDIRPTNFPQWFSSYLNFILHYAKLAQEFSVPEFCIGAELKKISTRPEWRSLIDTLRRIYNGKLTYAANWDEYPNVNFWQDLDYIGINGYFPLAENREATIEEYLENFQLWLNQIDNFYSKVKKNIIITEIGFRSIKGSGVRPYDWQTQGVMDENSQANAYETILTTLQRKSWLWGIYFWKWDPILYEDPTGYSPYHKKASEVIKRFWR